jgi:prevent-host-death family protein
MEKILPITDLQRRAGQIVDALRESDEPVVITQRGRPAAILISAEKYRRIEEDLGRLDDLEMEEMVREGKAEVASGNTISHREVKRRIAPGSAPKPSKRKAR